MGPDLHLYIFIDIARHRRFQRIFFPDADRYVLIRETVVEAIVKRRIDPGLPHVFSIGIRRIACLAQLVGCSQHGSICCIAGPSLSQIELPTINRKSDEPQKHDHH